MVNRHLLKFGEEMEKIGQVTPLDNQSNYYLTTNHRSLTADFPMITSLVLDVVMMFGLCFTDVFEFVCLYIRKRFVKC